MRNSMAPPHVYGQSMEAITSTTDSRSIGNESPLGIYGTNIGIAGIAGLHPNSRTEFIEEFVGL